MEKHRWAVIENGVVDNIIVAYAEYGEQARTHRPQTVLVDLSEHHSDERVQIGDAWDGTRFSGSGT